MDKPFYNDRGVKTQISAKNRKFKILCFLKKPGFLQRRHPGEKTRDFEKTGICPKVEKFGICRISVQNLGFVHRLEKDI